MRPYSSTGWPASEVSAAVNTRSARAITEHAKRGGELRLGDGGGEVVELGVGVVAQIAERRCAVAREHVERIGERAAAVAARLLGVAGVVLEPIKRELEGAVRHHEAALARPCEKVAHIGVEPDIVTARRPQPERAVRALAREQPI